tara:strand:- start:87009 stop:89825 length:2817 start_codon:yes stop_codon:yes gene_type:complete
MVQGIGYKDADGSYGFRLTEDGKVILGNSSDDLIQVSGTLDVSGSIYATDSIYVDVIRRHEDSSTTTKIRLMDEQVRIHAGNVNDEVLKIESGAVTIDGSLAITDLKTNTWKDASGNTMLSDGGTDLYYHRGHRSAIGSFYIKDSSDNERITFSTGGDLILNKESGTITQITGAIDVSSTVTANAFSGDGSSLTGIPEAGLASNCVTETKVATSVAGNGIIGGGGSALAVGAGTGVTVNANDVAIGQAVGTGNTPTFAGLVTSGDVIIGDTSTTSNERVKIVGGTDSNINLLVMGADDTTEYVGVGILSGVPTVTAGYVNTGDAHLAFATENNGSITEKMRITKDGKVGIGKNDPTVALAIGGDFGLSDSSTVNRVTLEAGTGADAFFGFGEDSNERGWIGWDAGDQKITLGSVSDNGTFNDSLVVNDSKVGIGTSTPYANLSIAGDHDGGIVSLRLGADSDAGSNYTSRLEFSEDTNGSQVMQWGAFLEFDGDALSPDLGMFTIGVRDDSTTDTDVIRISRKADAHALVLGDTTAQVAVSGNIGLTSHDGNITLQTDGNEVHLNGQVHCNSSANFSGDVVTPQLAVNTNALFVSSANSRVGMGTNSPSFGQLEVYKNSSTSPANITIHQDHSSGDSRLHLRSDVNDWYIINDGGSDDLVFINESTERMRLANNTAGLTVQSITCNGQFTQDSGAASFDHSLGVAGPFTVRNGSSPVGHLTHTNTTDGTTKTILKLQHEQEDSTADFDSGERFIEFYDSDSMLGYIHSEVSYSTFTGTHVSQQKAGQDYSGWKKGMILSSTGEVLSSGDISRNWIQVGLNQQQKDPKVAGVFTDFMTEHELKDFDPTVPAINYNALGEGKILVTNINGNIENGDYITTCEIPGYGMKQDDDLLHNYTVAKITQDCLFDLNSTTYECEEIQHNGQTYRAAFVGCTYHCG